jgi:hypothetical protein
VAVAWEGQLLGIHQHSDHRRETCACFVDSEQAANVRRAPVRPHQEANPNLFLAPVLANDYLHAVIAVARDSHHSSTLPDHQAREAFHSLEEGAPEDDVLQGHAIATGVGQERSRFPSPGVDHCESPDQLRARGPQRRAEAQSLQILNPRRMQQLSREPLVEVGIGLQEQSP